MVLVAKMDQSHDAPEVIDPVGVIEGHAPAVGLRRKTAEEKDARSVRQEGLEGVLFSGHGLADIAFAAPREISR